jgi:thioesterase domain-containing protein
MTIDWLWLFETELRVATRYNLDPATASRVLWKYAQAIQALKSKKIKWLDRWNNRAREVIIVPIDGVHCMISEPRRF